MNKFLTPLAVLTTVILWASAFAGIRAALPEYPPIPQAVFRFIIASLTLGIIASIKRIKLPERKDLPIIVIISLFGITIYNFALNYGELTVTASSASFIINTTPTFITLGSVIFLSEKINNFGWLGAGLSVLGIALVAFGEGEGLSFNFGTLLVVIAAFSTTTQFIIQKPLLGKYGAFNMTCYYIWTGTLLMLPFSSGTIDVIANASANATLSVIYLGVLPGSIAYVTWTYAMKVMPVSKAASFLYLIPVTTIIISYFWLREVPTLLAALGGFVALSGVIIINTLGMPGKNSGD